MKKQHKRLTLNKLTIATLTTAALGDVDGGRPPETDSCVGMCETVGRCGLTTICPSKNC